MMNQNNRNDDNDDETPDLLPEFLFQVGWLFFKLMLWILGFIMIFNWISK